MNKDKLSVLIFVFKAFKLDPGGQAKICLPFC